jgi:hypothetical protein
MCRPVKAESEFSPMARLYPDLNRAERKRLEAIRLGSISDRAQTIKYADFGSVATFE